MWSSIQRKDPSGPIRGELDCVICATSLKSCFNWLTRNSTIRREYHRTMGNTYVDEVLVLDVDKKTRNISSQDLSDNQSIILSADVREENQEKNTLGHV